MAGGLAPSRKGRGYERELVKKFAAAGIKAERTYGSNGMSRGLHKEVDLVVRGRIHLQAKRGESLPDYLTPERGYVLMMLDKSAGEWYAALFLSDYMQLLCRQRVRLKMATCERPRIGKTWRPCDEVMGQVARPDRARNADVIVMRRKDFLLLYLAVHTDKLEKLKRYEQRKEAAATG